jgi:hypothetical protein
MERINHKIHLKADLSRCSDSSADFEKVIMTLLMRILNRKNPKFTITSEQKIKNSEDIADVSMYAKDQDYHWELQKNINKEWNNKIKNRDINTNTTTIVIPLKPLIKRYGKTIQQLTKELESHGL